MLGSIIHTAAAALGLSAFLATSAWAFGAIKLLGGGYLVFLGIKLILERGKQLHLPSAFRRADTGAAFRQGILTNVLNPKVALFFLAFLPQFIDPASPAKIPAFLVLGLTFVTTGTIWCMVLAWFAAAFSERFRASRTISQWVNRTIGSIFVFLGAKLAVTR
jgi:threonine/homoserine/homoserine lactone efflux protein